jgi:hypothetical protein
VARALAQKQSEAARAAEAAPVPPQPAAERGLRATAAGLWARAALRWLAGGIVGALVVTGLYFWLARAPKPTAPRSKSEALRLAQRAEAALHDGKLAEAQDLIAQIQRIDPSVEITRLASRLLVDKKAKNSMDMAEGLVAQRRFDDARAELARTPEGDDAFRSRHDRLAASITQVQMKVLTEAFHDALAKRDFTGAEQALDAFPKGYDQDFRSQLAQERKRAHQEAQEDEAKREVQRKRAHEQASERRKGLMLAVFSPVSHRLDEEDFRRAELECDRIAEQHVDDNELRDHANRVKSEVAVLKRNYLDGQQKLDANASRTALKPLRLAHDVYYSYMGMNGELGHKLDTLLATALLSDAKAAEDEKADTTARTELAEVVRLVPASELSSKAQGELDRLQAFAQDLFARAMSEKDNNPSKAEQTLKRALDLSPADSAIHQKAKRALAALGR